MDIRITGTGADVFDVRQVFMENGHKGTEQKKGATFKLSPRSGSIILHFVGYEIGTVQAFLFDSDFGTRISSMPSL
jgi:hypothetical protein